MKTDTFKARVRQRLEDLMAEHHGRLTPDVVIADAKKKSSPLHGQFTWNVGKAAYERWVEQARELIRSVRVEVTTSTCCISAPRYVDDPRSKAPGYVEVSTLKPQKVLAREALRGVLDRVLAGLERAQEIAAVLGLQEEVTKFLTGLRELKEQVAA